MGASCFPLEGFLVVTSSLVVLASWCLSAGGEAVDLLGGEGTVWACVGIGDISLVR